MMLTCVDAQIVRELKMMAQALRPPRNRAKAVAAASISSAELDARGIPSGRPKLSASQVWSPARPPRRPCAAFLCMDMPLPSYTNTGGDESR